MMTNEAFIPIRDSWENMEPNMVAPQRLAHQIAMLEYAEIEATNVRDSTELLCKEMELRQQWADFYEDRYGFLPGSLTSEYFDWSGNGR